MKLQLDQILFINLLYRIFLLTCFLKPEQPEKSVAPKAIRHWLDPISHRVILIFINGLEKDFLKQNATPYMARKMEESGCLGVAFTGYMQTNHEGIRTVLTGKNSPSFPFNWMRANCQDSVLSSDAFICGMGNLPMDLPWKCHFPDKYPLENFYKFPGLLEELKKRRSNLFVMSFDLDPISARDYRSRLRKIDDDIQFFSTVIDNFHGENKTTYIVTSARGSPVGDSLSTDVPVLAWGKGINNYINRVTHLSQTDLTAMLCALLGINFPARMFALIPMDMMDLHDYYEYELTLYTIRHFEIALEVVEAKDHVYNSLELELEQLGTRMGNIVLALKRRKMVQWSLACCWLILLQMTWGLHLTSYASSEFACFFWNLKSLFLLLLVVGSTITYKLFGLELLIVFELLLFWALQNFGLICDAVSKNFVINLEIFLVTFTVSTVVGIIGNEISLPLMLVPVILWPFFNGSFVRLNRFVLLTRLLSGIVLGVLPMSRVFGEMPDRLITVSISFLFLIMFYVFIYIFNRNFDFYMKTNFAMILITTAHVYFIRKYTLDWTRDAISCFLLTFSFLSIYFASGTLLEKLFKIHLSLFVPVLMLTVRPECIFYLSIFFSLFSWIFTNYHGKNPAECQFFPPIFSIEPKNNLKQIRFSDGDVGLITFFLIYNYVSYFAIGHYPDLHSYDLYVVPTFIYKYPHVVSYFLGGFKFFLPFFIVTTSFMTLCVIKEKNFKPLIMMSLWVSDLIGCFVILYSQFINRLLARNYFPAKFSYFVVQQFATVSVILSFFIGKYFLLTSERVLKRFFDKNATAHEIIKN